MGINLADYPAEEWENVVWTEELMADDQPAITLIPTGTVKRTGFGDLPKFTTTANKPERAGYQMGYTYLTGRWGGPGKITGWIWVNGPGWEAMVSISGGEALYTDVIGGIQDK